MYRTRTALLIVFLCALFIPGVAAQEDVTLTLWTHDSLYVDFFSARAEEWKENYPDINFTFDFQTVSDVDTVVLSNLAAGEPIPDILGIEQGQFPRYMRDGILADAFVNLRDEIGDNYDRIAEGRWTLYAYDGGIYGVDSGLSTVAYYYQPAILEELGIEVPTTWEEFLAAGEQASANGIHLAFVSDDASMFQFYFLQRGGQLFDAEGNFVFDEEPNRTIAMEVLDLWRRGLDNGAFGTFLTSEMWGPTPIEAYKEGQYAGAIMPDWYGDYILKAQAEDMAGQWRIAHMPVWDDGNGTATSVWGGTGFAVSQQSEHQDLAWDLIEYSFLTYEGQVLRYQEIGYYPTMMEAFEDESIVGYEDPYYDGQMVGRIWADTVTEVPVWYQSPYRAVWMDAITERMPLFFDGDIDAATFVDEVGYIVEDEIAFDS
ncbi:carbohydrate ABC transporter substrate-binding protein [Phototrophicus methaneseepsis]|uniref:Carbohydrate ABC transporter substrate-binding protein n=1 Tax=Phototrophicus methaneseepsis TaxID=2710758 RepID=A0A7S8E5M0_9CHLR|nr:ABC transporter substrate-binding protein [Phototrophicus methaneseepsis]QPC80823.1 carbohydrate ABC transporter substrate-binding protein [Phototrophicus methaneseepsis]